MKKILLGVALLPSLLSANFVTREYSSWANQALTEVWSNLNACGLTRLDAYDPRLPQPLVPATDAIVNRAGQLLAYTLDTTGYFFPPSFAFKNPNGGYAHTVTFSGYNLSFNTPYGGTVDMSNVVKSVNGPYFQFFCHGELIPGEMFYACVKANWINVVTHQLCRFQQ